MSILLCRGGARQFDCGQSGEHPRESPVQRQVRHFERTLAEGFWTIGLRAGSPAALAEWPRRQQAVGAYGQDAGSPG